MQKTINSSLWTEAGYVLFAKDGLEGIQVERLARILQLNKSGFYHYFGDRDVFSEELLKLHVFKATDYLNDVAGVKSIDPEYLQVVVKHKVAVMFHIRLIRIKNNQAFQKVVEKVDHREGILLRDLWTDYIGFYDNPDLAIRYFTIVRDMFYTRLSLQNMNYEFMHNLMTEAKELMQHLVRQSEPEIK